MQRLFYACIHSKYMVFPVVSEKEPYLHKNKIWSRSVEQEPFLNMNYKSCSPSIFPPKSRTLFLYRGLLDGAILGMS